MPRTENGTFTVSAKIALAGFILAVILPMGGAIASYVRVEERLSHTVSTEYALEHYATKDDYSKINDKLDRLLADQGKLAIAIAAHTGQQPRNVSAPSPQKGN